MMPAEGESLFPLPILTAIRARVLAAAPDVGQALKWGMPNFTYQGKILCNMVAFKAHATFGFWHGELVTGPMDNRGDAMGSLGKITSVADLPDETRDKRIATTIAQLAKCKKGNWR